MAPGTADERVAARLGAALRAGSALDTHPADAELAAWLDGRLAGEQRTVLEAHLAACSDCAEVVGLVAPPQVQAKAAVAHMPRWRVAASILLLAAGIAAAVTAGRTTGERIETLALARVDSLLGGRVSASRASLVYDDGPALAFRGLDVRILPGAAPLLAAPQAILRPDLKALAAGELRGRLELPSPSFTIVARADGFVTIDPLLPDPARPAAVREKAWRASLDEVRLRGATVRYIDQSGVRRKVVHAAAVDAEIGGIASGDEVDFAITGGVDALRRNFDLVGEVLPDADGGPRWEVSRAELSGFPLTAFGNFGGNIVGRIDYEGALRAQGVGWRALWASLAGSGKLRLRQGMLRGQSLLAAALGRTRTKVSQTRFESAHGDLRFDPNEVALEGFELRAAQWSFRGRVSRDASGIWEVDGRVSLAPQLARGLADGAAERTPDGRAEIEVHLRGAWPHLKPVAGDRPAADVPAGSAAAPAASAAVAAASLDALAASAGAVRVGAAPLPTPADFVPLAGALRRTDAALQRRGENAPALATVLDALGAGDTEPDALLGDLRVTRSDEVLLTGYYEPVLDARHERSGPFVHALHALPADPAVRSATRAEIAAGALDGAGSEIFFVSDPVELFFLHVQGSGVLRLGDGSLVRVGYAGNNGHAYHSIGTELVRRGALSREAADAPGIRRWLRAHPREQQAILNTNPRYIFFRARPHAAGEGPVGSLGVPLEAWHSVAADPAVTRPGSIGRLRTVLPDGRSLDLPVVAMDSGAAIRGRGRIDLFLGTGDDAGDLAGVLRAPARVDWLQ